MCRSVPFCRKPDSVFSWTHQLVIIRAPRIPSIQWSPVIMWLVRLSSMLALVVALLLPPGLYRDCCCSKRASVQRAETVPVRACCQARLKAANRIAIAPDRAATGLKHAPCRCRSTATTLATLGMKHQRLAGDRSDWSVDQLLPRIETIRPIEPSNLTAADFACGHHQVGPPLRKTLCRWVI
jgi:hypothetical protein